MADESKMMPVIILPTDTMTEDNIARLRDNGLCVVEAKEPALVKFLDPIPAIGSRTQVENAAIELSRKILRKDFWSSEDTRKTVAAAFYDILVRGTPLDPRPSKQEVEKEIFDSAKQDELRRLAREEAKAEREAAKKSKTVKPAPAPH